MAYIFGFTCADGNIYHRTLAWELTNRHQSNKDLLERFRVTMLSNYPIEERKKSVRFRISNPVIISDIKILGVFPNKSKQILFPEVPDKYLCHFIRGFLDADGWIVAVIKKGGTKELSVGFCSGSKDFIDGLIIALKNCVGIVKFNLRKRLRKTKKGKNSITYQLDFYSDNAYQIIKFLYDNLTEEDLYLQRKFEKQLIARKFYEKTKQNRLFGRNWVSLERKNAVKMDVLLKEYLDKGLLPKEIAARFGVSLSSLYRWLDKSKVRLFSRRSSQEWTKRILMARSK